MEILIKSKPGREKKEVSQLNILVVKSEILWDSEKQKMLLYNIIKKGEN